MHDNFFYSFQKMEKSTIEKIRTPIAHEGRCLDILERVCGIHLHVHFQRCCNSIIATTFGWAIVASLSVHFQLINLCYHLICYSERSKILRFRKFKKFQNYKLLKVHLIIFHFSDDAQISNEQIIWCAGAFLANTAVHTILLNQIPFTAFHIGMKIRTAVSSIVYRKVSTLK